MTRIEPPPPIAKGAPPSAVARLAPAFHFAILFISYAAAAVIGLRFASAHGNVSPVWPASAVALSGLVLAGHRHWPAVWLAATAVSVWAGAPLWAAALVSCGIALQALLGAEILRRRDFRPQLDRVRDLVDLWILGTAAPCAVGAAIGVSVLRLAGLVDPDALATSFGHWFVGDVFGIVILSPLLLVVPSRPLAPTGWARRLEGGALLLVAVLIALVGSSAGQGYPYLPFFALLWAVTRFDLRMTAAVVVVVAGITVVSTARASAPDVGALVDLYRFLAVYGIGGLSFAALAEGNRRALRRVRELAQRYENVFRSSPLPKLVVEAASGRIEDLNRACVELFGWTAEEARGRTPSELGIWRREEDAARFHEHLAGGHREPFEAELRTRDGRVLEGLISSSTMETGGGARRLSTFQDLTAMRSLERQVQNAQKLDSLGRLAGAVAHDVNNLLTVVAGNADLAGQAASPSEQEHYLYEVRAAVDRAAELTRRLLAFGRRQIFDRRPLDLNAVIGDLEGMLRGLVGAEVRLELELEPALPRALLDRPQLEQVIMNLVINARDAVPAGGTVSLRTRTGELESEGGGSARAVLLEVADDGVGFGDEVRARLFEPFFTTKEAGRGTGLGLSTVYGIVKQSGGEIEVDSTPGGGARFRIRLPAVEGAAPVAEAVAPRALAAHGRKVLVVEEDAPLRALMARALRLSGFEVVEAGSASEALGLDNGFGLVVAALGLSDRSGTELVARLRERTPDLPVVYCAGEPGTMPAGHEGAPALDGPLLRKPFTVPELQEAVRAAL